METVFGLVEDDAPAAVHDFIGYLLPPVCRETVEHDRIPLRTRQECAIHLVRPEPFLPLLGFPLLPHADPDIGVHTIGITDGFPWVGRDLQVQAGMLFQFTTAEVLALPL